jgi:hypothetical protein
MSLLEMRDMRDLEGARQWELDTDARNCTDPMNSDMAATQGYQNEDKERRSLIWGEGEEGWVEGVRAGWGEVVCVYGRE